MADINSYSDGEEISPEDAIALMSEIDEEREEALSSREASALLDNLIAEKKQKNENQRLETATSIIPSIARRDPKKIADQARIAEKQSRVEKFGKEGQRDVSEEETVIFEKTRHQVTDVLAETQIEERANLYDTEKAFIHWPVIDEKDIAKEGKKFNYKKIGDYEIIEELGRGGMGVVLRAYDPNMRRDVALKIIWPKHDETLEMGIQEALIQANHKHGSILPIYQVATFSEKDAPKGVALVLEIPIVKGTLSDKAEEIKRMNYQEKELFFKKDVRDIIQGLSQMHRNGVIHRDLKPSNLYVHEAGYVMIGDFGLSTHQGYQSNVEKKLGAVGTPQFFSPEQALGKELDPSSDFFSLGTTLYELLTGRTLFDGTKTFEEFFQFMQLYAGNEKFKKKQKKRMKENMALVQVPRHLAEFIIQLLEPDKAKRLRPENIREQLDKALKKTENVPLSDLLQGLPQALWKKLKGAFQYANANGINQDARAILDQKPFVASEVSLLDEDSAPLRDYKEREESGFEWVVTDTGHIAGERTKTAFNFMNSDDKRDPVPQEPAFNKESVDMGDVLKAESVDSHAPIFTMPLEDPEEDTYEQQEFLEDSSKSSPGLSIEKSPDGELILGNYRIGKQIASSQTSVTYEAVNTKFKRPVKIELLTALGSVEVNTFVSRVRRQAKIKDPSVNKIYDMGFLESRGEEGEILSMPFMVMENGGTSLDSLSSHFQVSGPRKKMKNALPYFRSMGEAIMDLHASGIRNLKMDTKKLFVRDEASVEIGGFDLLEGGEEMEPLSDWKSYAETCFKLLTGEERVSPIRDIKGRELLRYQMAVLKKHSVPKSLGVFLVKLMMGQEKRKNPWSDDKEVFEALETALQKSEAEAREMASQRIVDAGKKMRERKKKKRKRAQNAA